MAEKKGSKLKPWEKAFLASELTPKKIRKLRGEADEVREEGSIPGQTLLQRRYQRRIRGTGP